MSDHIKHMSRHILFKRYSPTPDYIPVGPPEAPVIILGSGLSALTLALSLHRKAIPFKIYTKDLPLKEDYSRHNYSILLKANTIQKLWKLLRISKEQFRKFLMVPYTTPFPNGDLPDFSARVHLRRVELLLILEFEEKIEWGCEIKTGSIGSPPLVFPAHIKKTEGNIIFDCMGVHSPIKCAETSEVHRIVVFRGTTLLAKKLWDQKFSYLFKGRKAYDQMKVDNVVLELIVDDVSRQNGDVTLTYIYSRLCLDHPKCLEDDSLWAPTRSKDEASSPLLIGKFLEELEIFRLEYILPLAYDEIFNPENIEMKKDKILHWLMRTKLASQQNLINLWSSHKILKLGDAMHGMAIIESIGAEIAIADGIDAAKEIETNGGAMFHSWLINRWDMKLDHMEAMENGLHRRYAWRRKMEK